MSTRAARKLKAQKAVKSEEPLFDSLDGELFFVSVYVMFEKNKVVAADYARVSGDLSVLDTLRMTKDPDAFTVEVKTYEVGDPEPSAVFGGTNTEKLFGTEEVEKAIAAANGLRTEIWPNANLEDEAEVGQFVVRKTYPGGRLAYFDKEDDLGWRWNFDKKSAHIFTRRGAALTFVRRTEEAHRQRIAEGKAAASNVIIEAA